MFGGPAIVRQSNQIRPSPWPFVVSTGVFAGFTSFLLIFHKYELLGNVVPYALILSFVGLLLWWKDVIRESSFLGNYTVQIRTSLRLGFQLFLVSELMLFVTYFWAFFHFRLSPAIELGGEWPPYGLTPIWPFGLVLINTALLVASGMTVEFARREFSSNNRKYGLIALGVAISEAIVFTVIQGVEYFLAPFDLSDGVFGSAFFSITGLHAAHVILGTLLLIVSFYRLMAGHFSRDHALIFLFATWYWHFVDIIWILVVLGVYMTSIDWTFVNFLPLPVTNEAV
jgi:cytochrome c oxidase subunit 3